MVEHVQDLGKYIASLNKLNDFDLAWRWSGADTEPWIEVYAETDEITLVMTTPAKAVEDMRAALPRWDLEDVIHYV